ncbi:hypothetical protein [Deinococcus sp.]|uniref:hypothetical protein n=1 Tax=Deinococcus sp. TaxID=47478 RepID=UPI0025FBF773|nr:hypothetical protein [Deinococcus sp.]
MTPITPETVRAFCESALVREADQMIAEKSRTFISPEQCEEHRFVPLYETRSNTALYLGFLSIEEVKSYFVINLTVIQNLAANMLLANEVETTGLNISLAYCFHLRVITNRDEYDLADYSKSGGPNHSMPITERDIEQLLKLL